MTGEPYSRPAPAPADGRNRLVKSSIRYRRRQPSTDSASRCTSQSASGCGLRLDLAAIHPPAGVAMEPWLTGFPSFGFLLAVIGVVRWLEI
jgi:hypothetical protein